MDQGKNNYEQSKKKVQAIKAFNIYVEKLILMLKPIILVLDEITEKEYDTVSSLIKNFVIPGNPKIIVSFFKTLIFDDYYDYIKNEDDSLFSISSIMNEYKNVFNKLKNKDAKDGMNEIGNFLEGKLVKKDNSKISKKKIEKQINKLGSGEGEKLFISKKTIIEININKCRAKWDSTEQEYKKDVWKLLQVMGSLIKNYIYN